MKNAGPTMLVPKRLLNQLIKSSSRWKIVDPPDDPVWRKERQVASDPPQEPGDRLHDFLVDGVNI